MALIKQILRLHKQGASIKSISRHSGISKNTVKKYLRLIEVSSLTEQELLALEDEKLDQYFIQKPTPAQGRDKDLETLFPHFEKELKRTGVTRWVLWGEYRQQYPQGYSYSRFCDVFQKYLHSQKTSLHTDHLPADKLYVDFAGKKLQIVDKETGEVQQVEVLVALLGYSQLTYVEAVRTQTKEDFIGACSNSVLFIGGSPKAIVCDNLKSGVDRACKYEPSINTSFDDFANHYNMAVIPTRSRKPQDKALVERAVAIAYSRIYAVLRNEIFFSLETLNKAIREALLVHNRTVFQNKDRSRQDIFDTEEKQLLQTLPQDAYELKNYREVSVMKNCHVQLREDFHYYSVPYRYIGKKIKLSYTRTSVRIYLHGEQIAYHQRDYTKYKYSTIKEHLPSHHQFVSDWNPEKFISWAAQVDPLVKEYITKVLNTKQHPEQAYKSCTGILSFTRKVEKKDLIAACSKGLELHEYTYSFIKRVLENGFAKISQEEHSLQTTLPLHENIRGKDDYK